MKLGVDFGTTRIVAAAADRGNYPVVQFECPDGAHRDWFPPLVALRGPERRYGWDAWQAQGEPSFTVVRSLKRLLENVGPETRVEIAGLRAPMLELLGGMLSALRTHLLERSSLPAPRPDEPLEVMLGVPANANSNQRFLTAEAFRLAGFTVLGMLNEPSAASIEFGHAQKSGRGGRERLLVYDLGGGTFDASLVDLDERTHEVLATESIPTLGGDDFDAALAGLALEAAGLSAAEIDSLTQAEQFHLEEECRLRKEALHPNTRKVTVDLGAVREGWPEVSFPVADFYDRARPLVEETLHAVDDLLARHGPETLDALYVTGGGSELPLVSRVLREQFGRRVKRSAYTRSATAIGLAIQAGGEEGYLLREKFTRHFGVWREADGGRRLFCDALFGKGRALPGPGESPLTIRRAYTPAHNIGHFRYLECSQLTPDGQPGGDVTLWDEIRFPFDPALRDAPALERAPVERSARAAAEQVEETYTCDASGKVTVTITNRTSGYGRSYALGRWGRHDEPVSPGRKKKGAAKGQSK